MAIVVLFGGAELVLRVAFGLGHPALVQLDLEAGYIFRPDQDVVRFGKHIHYNHFSQRSDDFASTRLPGLPRILMIGDSVLNGGNPIDQSETITAVLQARLEAGGVRAEVLNASAGSWAIANRLGYLHKFGVFDSDLVVVQMGIHSLFQHSMTTAAQISPDPNFAFEPPRLVVFQAWSRYIWPRFLQPRLAALRSGATAADPTLFVQPPASAVEFEHNMELFKQLVAGVAGQGKPLWVFFTAAEVDVAPDTPRSEFVRTFLAYLSEQRIPVVNLLDRWSGLPLAVLATYYRDGLHLTAAGDRAAAEELSERLLPLWKPEAAHPPAAPAEGGRP